MSKEEFFQEAPELGNQFVSDPWLQSFLKTQVPADIASKWTKHLQEVGADAAGKLLRWSEEAEANPPKHIPYDAWGKRIDRVEVSRAWKDLEAYAAEHGLIAEGYERNFGSWSRVYQMILLYLYHPSSAYYSCPLAMTDGAARALEVYGSDELKKTAFKNLTSRDPKKFWTSGQWMTERTGGSDVGQSLTQAKPEGSAYALHGTKWFTSATTAQMAMTLARLPGAEAGGRGLSLFYVKLHDEKDDLQNIHIHRLKDKLGTKALPTAELSLEGTPAQLVGDPGNGIKKIATLFNITRIYNAVCSVGFMRRAIALGVDYSKKREAFGKKLIDQPLHVTTLFPLWADAWGCSDFVFELVRLLGRDECGEASADESQLLRLYTPLAKLYTGKRVVSLVSEVIEMFGGAGYVEDTGLPRLLRDCQVLPIWEGTTNVLSLDVLRALQKECSIETWAKDQSQKIQSLKDLEIAARLKQSLDQLLKTAQTLMNDPEEMTARARDFAFALAELSIASLTAALAQKNSTPQRTTVAEYWSQMQKPFAIENATSWKKHRSILFES